LKRLIPILIIFSFALQSVSGIWVFVNFYVNRDYIAENQCVNRFEEIPICKGQCYLTTELKKTEKKKNDQSPQKQKERLILAYNSFTLDYSLFVESIEHNLKIYSVQNEHNFNLERSIFHPPRC